MQWLSNILMRWTNIKHCVDQTKKEGCLIERVFGANLASTQECTKFCAKSRVKEIYDGAVTGSFCDLDNASGNTKEDKCYKRPCCTCICLDGDIYYDVKNRMDDDYHHYYYDGEDTNSKDHKEVCDKFFDPISEYYDPFFDNTCFLSIATFSVNGKGRVMIKDLANGDNVLTMDGSYQTIYSMNHYHTSKETTFVQIKTNL